MHLGLIESILQFIIGGGMILTLKSRKRVNFEDCDPLGHLNNVSYVRYFINERENQLVENNILDLQDHARKTGNSWVVVSHNIKYVRPVLLGETVEIWSRLLTYERSANLVEFLMFSPETKQLKSVMHSQFVYFSIHQKKMAEIQGKMKSMLDQSCLYPHKSIKDFHVGDRISHIKKELA